MIRFNFTIFIILLVIVISTITIHPVILIITSIIIILFLFINRKVSYIVFLFCLISPFYPYLANQTSYISKQLLGISIVYTDIFFILLYFLMFSDFLIYKRNIINRIPILDLFYVLSLISIVIAIFIGIKYNQESFFSVFRNYIAFLLFPPFLYFLRQEVNYYSLVKKMMLLGIFVYFPFQIYFSIKGYEITGNSLLGTFITKPDMYFNPSIQIILFFISIIFFESNKKIASLLFFTSSFCILISFGRSFWLGTFFGVLVLMIFINKEFKWKKITERIFVTFIGLIFIFPLVMTFAKRILNFELSSIASRFNMTNAGSDASVDYRIEELLVIPKYILEKPFTGWGIGATLPAELAIYFPNSTSPWWIHNEILFISYSIGLIGFILITIWFIGNLLTFTNQYNKINEEMSKKVMIFSVVIIIALMMTSLSAGQLISSSTGPFVILIISIARIYNNNNRLKGT